MFDFYPGLPQMCTFTILQLTSLSARTCITCTHALGMASLEAFIRANILGMWPSGGTWSMQECTKVYKTTREDRYAECSQQMYVDVLKCAKVGKHIQECAEVYRSMQVLAHLISQRWLCREETYTCCCHGFQFLSLWVKGSKRMREGRG